MKAVCEPFEHVSGQDAITCELGSRSHQFIDGVLALVANDGCVMKIDDELASLKALARTIPSALQFCEPRLNKLSFHHQAALRLRINRGNLQHAVWWNRLMKAIPGPKLELFVSG